MIEIDKTKLCNICKKIFNPTVNQQIYCSYSCYLKAQKIKKDEKKIKYSKKCPICNKLFFTTNKFKKYCSTKCSIKMSKIYRKKPKLARTIPFKKSCHFCSKIFLTFYPNKNYCSRTCYKKVHPTQTKKTIIEDIRSNFLDLKRINPALAQKIADEMEIIEGEKFRDEILDGFAPFRNPKKYNKKSLIYR